MGKCEPDQFARRFSKERLRELVREATVDAYGEVEQVTGLYTMIEDNLELPFETKVLGVPVVVKRIELTDQNDIVAVCRQGGLCQDISLLRLPVPPDPPDGSEWIAAYRHWAAGGW